MQSPTGLRDLDLKVACVHSLIHSPLELAVVAIGNLFSKPKTKSDSKANEKDVAIRPTVPTVIFRYHASKQENLAPRPGIDFDGLSFSTKPPRPGVSAVVTTIEEINSTGILMAIPTGGSHVIVVPTNAPVVQWMRQGQSSIWSFILSRTVTEWNGGF